MKQKMKAHIYCTLNNTHVTITDDKGNKVCGSSAGLAGFKGAVRATAFAGQKTGYDAGVKAISSGIKSVEVHLRGFGKGRFTAPKGLKAAGLRITSLHATKDNPPHNGCRPKKIRRL